MAYLRSGSAQVIPAAAALVTGSIIQTTALVEATTSTTVSTPAYSGLYASTVVTGAITPQYSNSSIIVNAKFTIACIDTGGDMGFAYKFWRSASSITDSYPTGVSGDGEQDTSRTTGRFYRNAYQYSNVADCQDVNWMDANVTIADEAVTYTLWISTYAVATSIIVGGVSNSRWDIFFQEVKR